MTRQQLTVWEGWLKDIGAHDMRTKFQRLLDEIKLADAMIAGQAAQIKSLEAQLRRGDGG